MTRQSLHSIALCSVRPGTSPYYEIADALQLRNDRGALEVVELGEIFLEVFVALRLNALLLRAASLGRAFAVAALDGVDDLHAFDDLAEGREAHRVEPAVVAVVD